MSLFKTILCIVGVFVFAHGTNIHITLTLEAKKYLITGKTAPGFINVIPTKPKDSFFTVVFYNNYIILDEDVLKYKLQQNIVHGIGYFDDINNDNRESTERVISEDLLSKELKGNWAKDGVAFIYIGSNPFMSEVSAFAGDDAEAIANKLKKDGATILAGFFVGSDNGVILHYVTLTEMKQVANGYLYTAKTSGLVHKSAPWYYVVRGVSKYGGMVTKGGAAEEIIELSALGKDFFTPIGSGFGIKRTK